MHMFSCFYVRVLLFAIKQQLIYKQKGLASVITNLLLSALAFAKNVGPDGASEALMFHYK